MATAESVKAKLQGLIDKANDTTGGADSDLTNAVKRLCDGYGSGESGGGNDQLPAVCEGTVTSLDLPTVTAIKDHMFQGCRQLTNISMPKVKNIGYRAFYYCDKLALTQLPDSLTSIGGGAFYCCSKLAITDIPKNCRSIGSEAFYNDSGLTEITFHGLTTIETYAFSSCINLKTITVPWAEGDVPNAPWGAWDATINYNCNIEGADSQAPFTYLDYSGESGNITGTIYFNEGWTWRDYIESDFNVYGIWYESEDMGEGQVFWDSYVPMCNGYGESINKDDLIDPTQSYAAA